MNIDKKITGTISAVTATDGVVSAKLNLSGDVESIAAVIGELSRIGEGLGIIIDPSIESITIQRLIESI